MYFRKTKIVLAETGAVAYFCSYLRERELLIGILERARNWSLLNEQVLAPTNKL